MEFPANRIRESICDNREQTGESRERLFVSRGIWRRPCRQPIILMSLSGIGVGFHAVSSDVLAVDWRRKWAPSTYFNVFYSLIILTWLKLRSACSGPLRIARKWFRVICLGMILKGPHLRRLFTGFHIRRRFTATISTTKNRQLHSSRSFHRLRRQSAPQCAQTHCAPELAAMAGSVRRSRLLRSAPGGHREPNSTTWLQRR